MGVVRMIVKITKTGVYDLPMADYHSQCTDTLVMGSSDAVLLANSTPAHLRASWDEEDESSKQADMGKIAHALLLEPFLSNSSIVVIEADDWRKKATQELRDDARASGKTPILSRDYDRAHKIVRAVMANSVAAELLREGQAEKSWFAKDEKTGLYKKCRPDFFNTDRIIIDIKTVASASPEFLKRRVYDGGWFQQAPWYCEVVELVERAPAKGYCWIIVEQEPPYAVVIRKPLDNVLMHGHRLNQQAFALFARCAASDYWPAYGDEVEELGLPDFAYYRLEESAVREDARGMDAARWGRALETTPFG
jgi:hypothetical protein